MQAELLESPTATLGEGPIWIRGRLHWVDILEKRVWISSPEENDHRCLQLDKLTGTVVPRQNGSLVVALQDGFYFLDEVTGKTTPIVNPIRNSKLRFNDGKCDPAGRFWAGSMPLEGDEAVGSLYVLDVDGEAHHRLGQIGCSNGLCWAPNQETMYYIDSPTQRVDVFDYTLSSGHIANRRTIVEIEKSEGTPDGMTIDAEGNLWFALWDGRKVVCHDPKTGKRLEEISVPVSRPTACTFGGEGYETLYITSARVGCEDEPLAGRLFQAKPGVRGMPAYSYSG